MSAMTKEEFTGLWTLHFIDAVPISHLFKQRYVDQWFRIHSLPESKRYAATDAEWEILLFRQNEVITDLFGEDTEICLVTGEYHWATDKKQLLTDEVEIYRPFQFMQLDQINLTEIDPKQYDNDLCYTPAFAVIVWKSNRYDKVLKEIADDQARAFFVSFDKKIIVAPYDGGVDFILRDTETRDFYKNKYKQYLSKRADGF
jgi:hypothetical protein